MQVDIQGGSGDISQNKDNVTSVAEGFIQLKQFVDPHVCLYYNSGSIPEEMLVQVPNRRIP